MTSSLLIVMFQTCSLLTGACNYSAPHPGWWPALASFCSPSLHLWPEGQLLPAILNSAFSESSPWTCQATLLPASHCCSSRPADFKDSVHINSWINLALTQAQQNFYSSPYTQAHFSLWLIQAFKTSISHSHPLTPPQQWPWLCLEEMKVFFLIGTLVISPELHPVSWVERAIPVLLPVWEEGKLPFLAVLPVSWDLKDHSFLLPFSLAPDSFPQI